MSSSQNLNMGIIIVEKNGNLKPLNVKEYKEEDLFKKCGFKKSEGFELQHEWNIKLEGKKYILSVFAKKEGNANMENKYDFPPPIDTTLFFGCCAIVCKRIDENEPRYISLSLDLWNKFYEKLFGGFETLSVALEEDELEEDELDNIPNEKKTKNGYLKDGFIVDSEEDEETEESDSVCEDDDDDEESDELEETSEEIDIGSELSEEEYEDESDDDKA